MDEIFPDRKISLKEKHQIKEIYNHFKYVHNILPQETLEAGQKIKSRACSWNDSQTEYTASHSN